MKVLKMKKMTTKLMIGSAVAALVMLVGGCSKSGSEAGEQATPAVPYPLDVCVVSGEKLGSMGEPYVISYEGRQIKFCCDGCEKDFRKEPAKFLAKVDAAAKP